MGKASSSKKVARAASTGGGRVGGTKTPWGWYSLIAAFVVLGIVLIVVSRNERQEDVAAVEGEPPRANRDHWHAAYSVYECGDWASDLEDAKGDPYGIHSHGDGVVHIHPFTRDAAGKNATLSVFAKTVDLTLSETKLQVPGGEAWENGDKCDGKPGKVQVVVWDDRDDDTGEVFDGNPGDLRLKDGQLITIAFAPEGEDIPKPPTADNLENLSDVEPTTTTSPPGGGTTSTTAAGGEATTTTAPGGGTTTTTSGQ